MHPSMDPLQSLGTRTSSSQTRTDSDGMDAPVNKKNLFTHTGRVHTHAYSEQEEEEGLRALAHISDRALKSRKP